MATYYWIGGTGNWSDTAKWSLSSGGSAANATPTSADDVVFDDSSAAGTFTVTVDAEASCRDFTCSITLAARKMTLARSAAVNFNIYGSWLNPGSTLFAWSGLSGTVFFRSTATGKTITTNGVSFVNSVTIDGVGGGWTLGGAWTVASFTLLNGTFSLGGFNLTLNQSAGVFSSTGSGTCTFDATGTPTIAVGLNWTITNANFSFTAGSSQINMARDISAFAGNGLTYYNVSFTSTAHSTPSITGANTFNNLTFASRAASGVGTLSLAASQTVSGTLSIQSSNTDPTRRLLVASNTLGATRTITTAAVSAFGVDIRDITIAGAAAPYNAASASFGDCGGNSGITFPTAKTVYWGTLSGSQNWHAIGWATTSGGTPAAANFPLAQDTAIIDEASTCTTLTFATSAYHVGTLDCSSRTTTALTLDGLTYAPFFYGDFILSSQTTLSAASSKTATFLKRGGIQAIKSAGKTVSWSLSFQSFGGEVALADNLASSGATLVSGSLNLNGKTLSAPSFTSSGTSTRVVSFGSSGVLSLSDSGTVFNVSGSGFSVDGTGKIAFTSSFGAKTGAFGGFDYSGVTISQEGSSTLTISGSNTFGDIVASGDGQPSTILITSGTTQSFLEFTLSGGGAAKVVTLSATSTGAAVLVRSFGIVSVSYLTISKTDATGGAEWNAFTAENGNIDGGGNSGWFFAPVGPDVEPASAGAIATAFASAFADNIFTSKGSCRNLGATIEAFVAAPRGLSYNSTAWPTNAPIGYVQRFIGNSDHAQQTVVVDSFGGIPGVWARFANGTGATATAPGINQTVSRFVACAWAGLSYAASPPELRAETAQAFTATTQGMRWVFSTIRNGTAAPINALWVGEDQSVLSAGALGYKSGSGAGNLAVQAGGRDKAVTLNAPSGVISVVAAQGTLEGGLYTTKFTLTNSKITETDVLLVNLVNYAGSALYWFSSSCRAGAADIRIFCTTNASEALSLQFSVIRGAVN